MSNDVHSYFVQVFAYHMRQTCKNFVKHIHCSQQLLSKADSTGSQSYPSSNISCIKNLESYTSVNIINYVNIDRLVPTFILNGKQRFEYFLHIRVQESPGFPHLSYQVVRSPILLCSGSSTTQFYRGCKAWNHLPECEGLTSSFSAQYDKNKRGICF